MAHQNNRPRLAVVLGILAAGALALLALAAPAAAQRIAPHAPPHAAPERAGRSASEPEEKAHDPAEAGEKETSEHEHADRPEAGEGSRRTVAENQALAAALAQLALDALSATAAVVIAAAPLSIGQTGSLRPAGVLATLRATWFAGLVGLILMPLITMTLDGFSWLLWVAAGLSLVAAVLAAAQAVRERSAAQGWRAVGLAIYFVMYFLPFAMAPLDDLRLISK